MVRAKVIAVTDSRDIGQPLNIKANQTVSQRTKRTLLVQSLNEDVAKVFARSGQFFPTECQANRRWFIWETALRKESFGLPLLLNLSSGCPLHAAGDYPLHIRVHQGLAIMTEGVVDRATLAVAQSEN